MGRLGRRCVVVGQWVWAVREVWWRGRWRGGAGVGGGWVCSGVSATPSAAAGGRRWLAVTAGKAPAAPW